MRYCCPCPSKAHHPSSCSNIRALSFSWPCFAFRVSRSVVIVKGNRRGTSRETRSLCDFQGQQPDKGKLLPRRARPSSLCTFFCLMAVHSYTLVGTELHETSTKSPAHLMAFRLSEISAEETLRQRRCQDGTKPRNMAVSISAVPVVVIIFYTNRPLSSVSWRSR